MRRWCSLAAMVSLAACNGGAGDAGRMQLARTQGAARGDHGTIVRPAGRVDSSDPAPTLITLTARGAPAGTVPVTTVVTSPVAAPRESSSAVPPAGGYVVRAPRAVSPGAPVPGGASVATVDLHAPVSGAASARPIVAMGGARDGLDGEDAATAYAAPSANHESPGRGGSYGHAGTASGGGRYRAAMRAPTAQNTSASSAQGYAVERSYAGGAASTRVPDGYVMADRPVMAPVAAAEATPPADIRIVVTTPPVIVAAPPPVVEVEASQYVAPSGVLTAASVGDADRRANYADFLSRHAAERESLGLDMSRRVRFRVLDAQNHPVNFARITVTGAGVQLVARTHADGNWDFYPGVSAPQAQGPLVAEAEVEGVGVSTSFALPAAGDLAGEVALRLPAAVQPPPPVLDLAFAIDVTGSMGDELRYVNREVGNIVQRIEAASPGVRVRVGSTFYRDRYDSVQLQEIPFSNRVPEFAAAMMNVSASGGGDYPEDMNLGLEAALTRLTWTDGPAVRVLVVIADAPPQPYADEQYTYRHAMADAARRGIRILPVAASGSNREVEYLFRAMGAFTSTPYVYLTDDSGVGGAHQEADTDRVAVERFNDLLTRLVVSDLRGLGMHEPGPLGAGAQ